VSANRDESVIRSDLRASCIDGCMFSVMVGAGETYFPAFALALGVDKVTAGLVATVPMLFGAAIQLVSPWAVRRVGANSRWVVWTAAAQAASFVPLIAAAALGAMPTWLLFAVLSLYWGAGFASGPSWTTWIEALVPARIRSRYFARRTIWCYLALVAALLGAGAALDFGDAHGGRVRAFAALFLAAAAARVASSRYLASQSDPVPQPPGERHVSMRELLRGPEHRPARRLVVFLLAAWGATQISQPFVTSYLRGELHMSYDLLALLLAVPFAARVAALPWLGRVAQQFGARRLMWVGAVSLAPAGAMWAVSTSALSIAAAQAATGFALAAFELATLLLWFETVPADCRTSVITTYQFWYAAAWVVGSAVGSVLLLSFGEGRAAFVAVFLVSAAARLAAAGLFARTGDGPESTISARIRRREPGSV
jgi:MFS family permease